MKLRVLICLLLFSLAVFAGEKWEPQWQKIHLSDDVVQSYVAEHHTHISEKQKSYWVFFRYPKPIITLYSHGESFMSEIQEWVVNCEAIEAEIASFNYLNIEHPSNINANTRVLIAEPVGVNKPAKDQIEAICHART